MEAGQSTIQIRYIMLGVLFVFHENMSDK